MSWSDSRPAFVLLILLTAGIFMTMLVFNALAANPSISRGLFKHSISNISAKYELQITPAGWTFSIWGLIFLFQAGWLGYTISNICRRVGGGPAYLSPCILSPIFFLNFQLNNLSNILWLFAWDQERILQAVPLLAITAATCICGLLVVYGRFESFRDELEEEGRQAEITVFRVFVFNGLAIYGAWTTIATVLNLGSTLAYKIDPPLDQGSTSVICLGLLTAIYMTFVVLDLTVMERFSRFTYSPYVLFLWAVAGILSKNWDPEQTASIIVAVLAGLGIVGLILKLVMSFWRQRQQPLVYRKLKVWATMSNEVYPSLSTK